MTRGHHACTIGENSWQRRYASRIRGYDNSGSRNEVGDPARERGGAAHELAMHFAEQFDREGLLFFKPTSLPQIWAGARASSKRSAEGHGFRTGEIGGILRFKFGCPFRARLITAGPSWTTCRQLSTQNRVLRRTWRMTAQYDRQIIVRSWRDGPDPCCSRAAWEHCSPNGHDISPFR